MHFQSGFVSLSLVSQWHAPLITYYVYQYFWIALCFGDGQWSAVTWYEFKEFCLQSGIEHMKTLPLSSSKQCTVLAYCAKESSSHSKLCLSICPHFCFITTQASHNHTTDTCKSFIQQAANIKTAFIDYVRVYHACPGCKWLEGTAVERLGH